MCVYVCVVCFYLTHIILNLNVVFVQKHRRGFTTHMLSRGGIACPPFYCVDIIVCTCSSL